jgi:threonine/homoserine/homoserine lactone efflux protein
MTAAAYVALAATFAVFALTPGPAVAAIVARAHEAHFWRNYGAGLLLMFGHVQAILFYAALLPGFVDMATLTAGELGLIGCYCSESSAGRTPRTRCSRLGRVDSSRTSVPSAHCTASPGR